MFGDGHHVLRDGRDWRLGTDADAAWINDGTSAGDTITFAIPPVFAAYCTLGLPETNEGPESTRHEQAVIELLTEQTLEQPWWLRLSRHGRERRRLSVRPEDNDLLRLWLRALRGRASAGRRLAR